MLAFNVKLLLSFSCCILLACGASPSGNAPSLLVTPETSPSTDASPSEATEDSVTEVSKYQACQFKSEKPTEYSRLSVRYCTDSNGSTYLEDYWDNILSIGCRWSTASDLKERCLPENVQTSFFFSDSGCNNSIALVLPMATQYVGLEASTAENNMVTVYHTKDKWIGELVYYQSSYEGDWSCQTSVWNPPGLEYFTVGDVVDPTTFVEK